jgi:hypothetical protein
LKRMYVGRSSSSLAHPPGSARSVCNNMAGN